MMGVKSQEKWRVTDSSHCDKAGDWIPHTVTMQGINFRALLQ